MNIKQNLGSTVKISQDIYSVRTPLIKRRSPARAPVLTPIRHKESVSCIKPHHNCLLGCMRTNQVYFYFYAAYNVKTEGANLDCRNGRGSPTMHLPMDFWQLVFPASASASKSCFTFTVNGHDIRSPRSLYPEGGIYWGIPKTCSKIRSRFSASTPTPLLPFIRWGKIVQMSRNCAHHFRWLGNNVMTSQDEADIYSFVTIGNYYLPE